MTSRLDFASGGSRLLSNVEEALGLTKATRSLLGHFGQRRQPFERTIPLYPAGMVGEASSAAGDLAFAGAFRSRLPARVFVTSMDITIIAFLGLLLASQLCESSSCKFQAPSEANVATAVEIADPKSAGWFVCTQWFLSAPLSSCFFLRRPVYSSAAAISFVLFLVANAIRWWVIRTLASTGTCR